MKMEIVLSLLRPGAEWVMNDGVITWLDKVQTQPTDDEIAAYISAYEYREQRAPEYPFIGDQLDALWKGGQAAADMLAQIQAVKAKYPKPS